MSAGKCVPLEMLTAIAVVLLLGGASSSTAEKPQVDAEKTSALEKLGENVTQGSLRAVRQNGEMVECPLRHTDVQADVSGFIARVKVTQTFYNPTDERIEAVYVFPLPHEAAVDDMTMIVGDRKIVGLIKRRAEARQVYEEALAAGQTAALLEQERPNIFTQSVGNLDPGQEVNIEIRYVDVLNYDKGTYEFHFPMVVGPRFIPGAPVGQPQATPPELQGKVSPPVPDTTRVPDASRISPPVLKPGFRNGHDISLSLRLEAGVPVRDLKVVNHEATVEREGKTRARVKLSPDDSIPNKDFVLRYYVVGEKPEMAVLSHTGEYTDTKRLGHGYFMLMVQPKEDERLTKSPPREIVFLLDVSGSMSGQPTEKVKEAMREMLKLCREVDTLQVITFAGQTRQLFDKPVPVNRENIAEALNFTQQIRGSGGTHMLEGVKRAIDQPIDSQRVRIVIMLTDGYIGNEAEIIEHVGKQCGDQVRFWAIGIGSSPNMFLIDGVARQGGGMGKRLALDETAAGLAEEVISRIQRAQLAKIRIDWGGLDVAETYPAKIPELWAGRPVILFGRYRGGGTAEITLRGVVEGEPAEWPFEVKFPRRQSGHDVLAKVWARRKIEDLMQQTYYAGSPAVEEEVTAIALDYRLMSQYTSFVAVDADEAERLDRQPQARPPRRMLVPVPLPEGTRWEGFFGPVGETLGESVDLAFGAVKREAKAADRLSGLGLAADGRAGARWGMPGRMGNEMSGMGMGMGGMGGGALGGGVVAGKPMAAGRPAMLIPYAPAPTNGPSSVALDQQRTQHYRYSAVAPTSGLARRKTLVESRGRADLSAVPFQHGLALGFALHRGETESLVAEGQYIAGALAADTEPLVQSAQQSLAAGRKAIESDKPGEARAELLRAYFLAAAAANRGNFQVAATAAQALADLDTLHAKLLDSWKQSVPVLGKKVDLVLRDVSVEEALEAIEKPAGLRIELIPGSVEDAGKMLAGRRAKVTYLDLRGATAAEALDWLLQPLRLNWVVKTGDAADAILVGSDRRLPRVSAWVYDVRAIALPTLQEQGKVEDHQKAIAQAKASSDQFVDAIRKALDVSETDAAWFAPGRLLLIGSPKVHEKALTILTQLRDPNAEPGGVLAALHKVTSRRAEDRREEIRKLDSLDALLATAAVHDEYSWQLLAAALVGELDLEALTELKIVWKAGETEELLEGDGAPVVLRSAWTAAAAAQTLPERKELAALAESARKGCRAAAVKAVASLKDKPHDASAILAAAYGAMATDKAELKGQVLASLGDEPATLVFAVRSLLGRPTEIDREQLAAMVASGSTVGEDAVVLTAMACRRAGDDAWSAFRAEMPELLGSQPLPGSVVVLANRLSGKLP